jgi:hypothetical protein
MKTVTVFSTQKIYNRLEKKEDKEDSKCRIFHNLLIKMTAIRSVRVRVKVKDYRKRRAVRCHLNLNKELMRV